MYANQTFSDMFATPYELNARMAEEQVSQAGSQSTFGI